MHACTVQMALPKRLGGKTWHLALFHAADRRTGGVQLAEGVKANDGRSPCQGSLGGCETRQAVRLRIGDVHAQSGALGWAGGSTSFGEAEIWAWRHGASEHSRSAGGLWVGRTRSFASKKGREGHEKRTLALDQRQRLQDRSAGSSTRCIRNPGTPAPRLGHHKRPSARDAFLFQRSPSTPRHIKLAAFSACF